METTEFNSYNLSRSWFDFCFENPEKVRPNHSAVYFFAIEHCNRLGWKSKFGFPTTMVMEAVGIKSYTTYVKTLTDLVDFGFIIMVEKSKNQYSSNIIALSKFDKALGKALDKALVKHVVKQRESIVSIIKQINNKQYNKEQLTKLRDVCNLFLNQPEEKKEKNNIEFDIFWDTYNKKKGDKLKCKKVWYKLSFETQNKIINTLPAFKESVSDVQYLPFPYTYLNQKRWNDELSTNKINGKPKLSI